MTEERKRELKEKRKGNTMYFKSGKPKKMYMLCRDPQYINEVTSINGYCNPNWICGGARCPLYSTGCDDRGRDWSR